MYLRRPIRNRVSASISFGLLGALTLVACSGDKQVHVFKASGSSIRKLQGHDDWIYSLAISRDGKTIASGSWDGDVRLWNLADGKPLRNFIAAPGLKPATTKAAAR